MRPTHVILSVAIAMSLTKKCLQGFYWTKYIIFREEQFVRESDEFDELEIDFMGGVFYANDGHEQQCGGYGSWGT